MIPRNPETGETPALAAALAATPLEVHLYQREQRSRFSSLSSAARLWAQAPPLAGSMAGAGRGSFPDRTLGCRFPGIAQPSRERLLGERTTERAQTTTETPQACNPTPSPGSQ